MRRSDRRQGARALAVLAGLLVLATTGTAQAGLGWLRPAPGEAVVASPQQGYVTYRPVLSRLLQPKQYYLNNYAGAQYPSRAPGSALTPTTFREMTGRQRLFGAGR